MSRDPIPAINDCPHDYFNEINDGTGETKRSCDKCCVLVTGDRASGIQMHTKRYKPAVANKLRKMGHQDKALEVEASMEEVEV